MKSEEAVCSLLDALAAAGVSHMVTGGLVSNAYGIPRSTHDADIVVQMQSGDFAAFARSLPEALRLDPQISFETITGSQRHIVELIGSPFRIELFFLGPDSHHQERFGRRVWKHLPDLEREAWIATAEDMVIQKVRWNRDKDRDDARNILAVQGDALDFGYIEKWCDAHGTRARLEELRRSIPPI